VALDGLEMLWQYFAEENVEAVCLAPQGVGQPQQTKPAGGARRDRAGEVRHNMAFGGLVSAGITPGLYAVRLGGGTMFAVTFRA
jgi:hypothetical protein